MPTVNLGAPAEQASTDGSNLTSTGPMQSGVYRGQYVRGAARWTNLAVPKGSTIVSAVLSLNQLSNTSGATIGVVLVDDVGSLTVSSGSAWYGAARSSGVAVSASVDITAGVQDLVNRTGWSSGNAVAVRQDSESSTFTESNATGLSVTYSDPYSAGPDQTVEPWELVTLTGTPSGASWSQVSGESVTLGGSGAVRTFTAPAKMTQHQMVFQYGTDQMTVTVEPAMHAIVGTGGTLTPTNMVVL